MPKFAILMTGSIREANFLCSLLPYVVGEHSYDIYLSLRKTNPGHLSRLGNQEKLFTYQELIPILNENVYLSVLPPDDLDFIRQKYVMPVGPTSVETEMQCLSMFSGIFAGVKQVKHARRSSPGSLFA